MAQGAGLRVWGSGCRVWSSGCRVWGAGFGIEGAGFGVEGLGFGVQGVGCGGGRGMQPCAQSIVAASDASVCLQRVTSPIRKRLPP